MGHGTCTSICDFSAWRENTCSMINEIRCDCMPCRSTRDPACNRLGFVTDHDTGWRAASAASYTRGSWAFSCVVCGGGGGGGGQTERLRFGCTQDWLQRRDDNEQEANNVRHIQVGRLPCTRQQIQQVPTLTLPHMPIPRERSLVHCTDPAKFLDAEHRSSHKVTFKHQAIRRSASCEVFSGAISAVGSAACLLH